MTPIGRWSPSDGLVLEPNALEAAKETTRNLALTAGPGAGKTEMLAQRADFLLRTATSRYPRRILAISFKVDAAQNLRARVRRRCGADLGARLDSYTFHAFAKRLIDQFRPVLKGANALDPNYSIGQRRVQRTSITFADMVPLAQIIIENSRIARNAVRQTYSHVFLDEFQDCTADQYALITACFGGSTCLLTAVGDTKQSIMGWAGALEGIFQTFADDFTAHPLNLYQNFRSAPTLRRMQNAMVRVMDPPGGRAVSVEGRRPRLSRWIGDAARPARFLAPIRIAIGLRDGQILLFTSQPSDDLRAYLQRRAAIGALGALVLLGVLMLAVRQTTRPLGALSRGVRRFADDLDAQDLPVKGPREVHELAMAFNDMKAQIRALVAERTRVLGAIAHDLRTYLTRLRLRAEFIEDAGQRNRAVRDLDEMTALVNDTLFLADRDSAPPARPECMLLGPVLGEIVGERLEFGDSVTLMPIAGDLAIAATPLALRRVLDNLIANGLRHGSCVTVAARDHGPAVDIVVDDDGPGVPAEALSRLGQPFQRFDPSRSRETGGAGLGLAIVRALALRDRAEVIFEQKVPNGLRVVLRYPRQRKDP